MMMLRKKLEERGIEIDKKHKDLKLPKKNATIVVFYFDDNEVKNYTVFDKNKTEGMYLRYRSYGNFKRPLSFNYESDKDMESRLSLTYDCTTQYENDILDDSIEFEPEKSIIKTIKEWGKEEFINNMTQMLNKVCLENTTEEKKFDDFIVYFDVYNQIDGSVLSYDREQRLNQRLYELDETSKEGIKRKDCFGNNASGFNEKRFKANDIYFFSRNEDTDAYLKFGKNSTESFVIGTDSRNKISETYDVIKENKLFHKHKENNFTYIIIPILFPEEVKENYLFDEFSDEFEEYSKWEQNTNNIIKAMRLENVNKNLTDGIIIILQRPDNGATNLRYFKTPSNEEMINAVERWRDGLENTKSQNIIGVDKYFPPNIFRLVKMLNVKWSKPNSKYKAIETKNIIKINDAFDFFFDEKYAINKIADVFAENHVKMLIDSLGDKNVAYEGKKITHDYRKYLFPISNLILHKMGFRKEDYMEHWAFKVGEQFKYADKIHRFYFESRGMSCPKELIGYKYIFKFIRDPTESYGHFVVDILKYKNFAENKKNNNGLLQYNLKKLNEIKINETKFPEILSSEEKIILVKGYESHYEPK